MLLGQCVRSKDTADDTAKSGQRQALRDFGNDLLQLWYIAHTYELGPILQTKAFVREKSHNLVRKAHGSGMDSKRL
jgi:hypothetical protein